MFLGFPLLRSFDPFEPLYTTNISFEELMKEYFGERKVDLTDAKLLDTYKYDVNHIQYEQKVYRLKDGSLYTTTKSTDASIEVLKKELDEAVAKQDFEKAAVLRDKLKSLK